MSDTYLSGLLIPTILMLISGYTYVAYKHHDRFQPFHYAVLTICIGVWLADLMYDIGVSAGFNAVSHFLDSDQLLKATAIATEKKLPLWVSLGAMFVAFYSTFLSNLPLILNLDNDKQD